MVWLASSKSNWIGGSSSMASGTALNRSLVTIPANVVITSYQWEWQLSPGVGAGTYNTLGTGNTSRVPSWISAISYVLTGNSAVNIISQTDDSSVLDLDRNTPGFDRLTINDSGSPTYQDQYRWTNSKRGRLQLPSGVGGQFFFHVGNTDLSTVTTAWDVLIRVTYV